MMQNHNQQKKIALINDFTGFGRCSIAVQMENRLRAIAIPGSVGILLGYVGLPEAARLLLSAELVSSLFAVLLCLVLHLLDV